MILLNFYRTIQSKISGVLQIARIAQRWRDWKADLRDLRLVSKLKRRQWEIKRARFKKYYPIVWRRQAVVAEEDITAYLAHEGTRIKFRSAG